MTGYKTILLLVTDDSAAATACRDAAIALAAASPAHLVALSLLVEPRFVPSMSVSLPADFMKDERERGEKRLDEILTSTGAAADRAGVSFERRRETVAADRAADTLARHGRHADLVVVGQPEPDGDRSGERMLVETAFMDTGRPALIIPFVGAREMPPRRVICAWDGSREAARAIRDALPLLSSAEAVSVLVVDAERLGGRVGEQPGADVAAYLARHGIRVEVAAQPAGDISAGDVLLSAASDRDADLIVMGGYGHSRLRQMVFGGVTSHLLAHMTVPVLLSR